MTALFVLPAIDPKVTGYLLRSLHPSLHERLFVVDNSKGGMRRLRTGALVHRPSANAGVAGSWNLGIAEARRRGSSGVVLLSGNVRFGAPGGRDLAESADAAVTVHAVGPCHWHTITWPMSVLDRFGMFDANLHPAYWEDVDATRRLALAGIDIDWSGSVDARMSGDGHGSTRLRQDHPGVLTINYEALIAYIESKWGCPWRVAHDPAVGYRTPWDKPENGLDYWPAATIEELGERYGIVTAWT